LYATGIWPVDRHAFHEHHFSSAAALLLADTAQPSSSESQNPQSDSEDSDDSSKDEDYESSGKRIKHFKKTLEHISSLLKLSADPRPMVSRRSRGRAQKATVLISGLYKWTLEHSKVKGKKRMQMKIQLSQATDTDANDGDSSRFCFLCGKSSKEGMIQCLQCRSWVHTPCAKVTQSMKKYCST
jgi:hypothetical protein